MAREWSATQSQYIGLNNQCTPDGRNVTTNGRAVAGSLVFGEKLCDWCIRELFPEAAPRRREEGMIYTVTHYTTDGKSIVEVAEWPDRTEAEAAMDHREEEIRGRRGTVYCESDEGMLSNVLLVLGQSLNIRPSMIRGMISATTSGRDNRRLGKIFRETGGTRPSWLGSLFRRTAKPSGNS